MTAIPLPASELTRHVGAELGVSDWRTVTQDDVDAFAALTGDRQWIHVDVERARSSPLGGTIVHGYFTLALAPRLAAEVYAIEGAQMVLNYGLDRVRFPAPFPVGGRVRLRAAVAEVTEAPGGAQLRMRLVLERDGGDKPVCVAESLSRVELA